MDTTGSPTARNHDTCPEESRRLVPALHWVYPREVSRLVRLTTTPQVIGRGSDNEMQVAHRSVSRQHAKLSRQGPVFVLQDLRSTNGTYLNGEPVQYAAISPGDVLRVGDCIAVVAQVPLVAPGPVFGELATGLYGGPALVRALAGVRQAATTRLPILIIGETGTGKECVARAIHEWSGRTGCLHAVNCAAVPDNLAEAELFGHRRGAFTGAERSTLGHFRAANGGTLLLDEIADLSPQVQAKLLRALERDEVIPLGDTEPVPIDVRVVVAAQPRLRAAVEEGRFREDLYARIAGLTVTLPPVASRREEIMPLFDHFLASGSGGHPPAIHAKLAEHLCLSPWPRNVREVKLLADHLLAVHGHRKVLKFSYLPEGYRSRCGTAQTSGTDVACDGRREDDYDRLVVALRETRGILAAAARKARISRARAYRLLNGRSIEEVLQDTSESEVRGERRESSANQKPIRAV